MLGLRRFIAGCVLAATAPQSLAALICPEPDALATFRTVAASEAIHVVIHGTLSATGAPAERGDEIRFPMRVEGLRLTRQGFTRNATENFVWVASCAGALSCPVAAPEGRALVFLRRSGGGDLLLEPGPCGETVHFGVDPAVLRAIAACHAGGRCD